MKFSDIPALENVKDSLRQMADSGRIPHAILLHGPSGLGKMQLARVFAQYINCPNRSNGEPCGTCPSCQQIQTLNHPDLHYIYPTVKPKGERTVISSDWINQWKKMLTEFPWMPQERWLELMDAGSKQPIINVLDSLEITRISQLSSYSSDYKIFIIWQPEKMNAECANKLLKLLEEPLPDTLFILVSNEPDKLLPTIFSRLQRIAVTRLSDHDVYYYLRQNGIDEESASRIASIAKGCPGIADALTRTDSERTEFAAYFRDAMRNAYAMKAADLKRMADTLGALGREKSVRLLEYFAAQIRENFIYNLRVPSLSNLTAEESQFSSRFSPFIHAGNVEKMASAIDATATSISRNANIKLAWFDFFLHLLQYLRIPKP
ncbi:MAG: DNA polymerase III subunit delta' [Muribaculum sp.]|nr:DNA polymerase III subunit delta' [Muribaculum sp.]